MLNVLSISTNTGVAPARFTLSALAKKVKEGTKTASVFCSSYAISGICKASVPLPQVRQYFLPVNTASLFSSSAISGPIIK